MATAVATKKIDADTHFNLTVDFKNLKDLLSRGQMKEADDMMWRDGERFADPRGVRIETQKRQAAGGAAGPQRQSNAGNFEYDPEARIKEMDKMGFNMQVLITQTALPQPLKPETEKPLWLRTAMAKLYNDEAAQL